MRGLLLLLLKKKQKVKHIILWNALKRSVFAFSVCQGGGILNCVVILLRNFFRLTVCNLHFCDKKYRNLTCCEKAASIFWPLAHSGSLSLTLSDSPWLTLAQILNFLSIVLGCLIYRGKEAIDISNGILMAPLDYMISKEDTCREIWKIKYVL